MTKDDISWDKEWEDDHGAEFYEDNFKQQQYEEMMDDPAPSIGWGCYEKGL